MSHPDVVFSTAADGDPDRFAQLFDVVSRYAERQQNIRAAAAAPTAAAPLGPAAPTSPSTSWDEELGVEEAFATSWYMYPVFGKRRLKCLSAKYLCESKVIVTQTSVLTVTRFNRPFAFLLWYPFPKSSCSPCRALGGPRGST